MKLTNLVRSRLGTIAAFGVIAAVAGAGSAVAAGKITSAQIKDNTITTVDVKDGTLQKGDLTKNNFGKFTGTEEVVSAITPVSTVPAYSGARVVDVAAAGTTPLVTLVLDKGTWKINGSAQFWHIGAAVPTAPDYGVVNIPGLQNGFTQAWTGDVPDGGTNAAQVGFSGTIKITTNDTPIVISGSFTGGNVGQAGVSVQATKFEYVKLFKNGQPT